MSYMKKIEQLIPTLSIEEKVGQLFVLAFAGQDTEYALDLVKNMHVGGFYLTDDNANTLQEASILSAQLQKQAALRACDAPLLLAVDQEGAWGILTKETDLGPGNLALGAANELELTESMYQVFAEQMQTIGYNTLLSPCADVNSNPDNPIIGQRSFGETTDHVAKHVAAAVKGINNTGNIACAKHFPGHGDTATDSHRALPEVTKNINQLLDEDLPPFIAAIENDVGVIMTAHINYPEIDAQYPATLSKKILTELLKEQLGFKGLIITDSMNMWAMRKNYSPSQAAILALKAGAHLVMLSEEHYENETTPYKQIQKETITGVVDAVHSGELSEVQIDETLKHILCFKYQKVNDSAVKAKSPTDFGKKIANAAARQAIQVLRNNDGLSREATEVFDTIVVGLYDCSTTSEIEEAKAFWKNRLRGANVRFSLAAQNPQHRPYANVSTKTNSSYTSMILKICKPWFRDFCMKISAVLLWLPWNLCLFPCQHK